MEDIQTGPGGTSVAPSGDGRFGGDSPGGLARFNELAGGVNVGGIQEGSTAPGTDQFNVGFIAGDSERVLINGIVTDLTDLDQAALALVNDAFTGSTLNSDLSPVNGRDVAITPNIVNRNTVPEDRLSATAGLSFGGQERQDIAAAANQSARNALASNLEGFQRAADQQRQESDALAMRQIMNLGPSNPLVSNRSLVDQFYSNPTTSTLQTRTAYHQRVADRYLNARSTEVQNNLRNREANYRASRTHLQLMRDSGLLDGIDDTIFDELERSLDQGVDELRNVRGNIDLEESAVREAISRNDYSLLPEFAQPSEEEATLLAQEFESREFTEGALLELQSFMNSNDIGDRMVVDAVRGLSNGAYNGDQVFAMLGVSIPVEQLMFFFGEEEAARRTRELQEQYTEDVAEGYEPTEEELAAGGYVDVPYLEAQTQRDIYEAIVRLTGRDEELRTVPGQAGFNPQFASFEALEQLDIYQAGVISSRAGTEGVIAQSGRRRRIVEGLEAGFEIQDTSNDFVSFLPDISQQIEDANSAN